MPCRSARRGHGSGNVRGSLDCAFEAQSHGLMARRLCFAGPGRPGPTQELASDCAATLCRVGFAPTGFALKSFSYVFSSHRILLSRAFLAQSPSASPTVCLNHISFSARPSAPVAENTESPAVSHDLTPSRIQPPVTKSDWLSQKAGGMLPTVSAGGPLEACSTCVQGRPRRTLHLFACR